MGRRTEIDAVRGLMLVWMVLTHLPTLLPNYTNQPFGFVSASEGFVFLSALFTGRVYCRLAEREGYPAMRRKLLLRTLRLYGYHALLLGFAFLVAVPIAARGNRPGLHNLLDFYFAVGPKQPIIEAFLLIYRPPLLDILPSAADGVRTDAFPAHRLEYDSGGERHAVVLCASGHPASGTRFCEPRFEHSDSAQ